MLIQIGWRAREIRNQKIFVNGNHTKRRFSWTAYRRRNSMQALRSYPDYSLDAMRDYPGYTTLDALRELLTLLLQIKGTLGVYKRGIAVKYTSRAAKSISEIVYEFDRK